MQKIHKVHFACGELYLFSDVPRMRDPESCLWGVYDRTDSGRIYLEHMACDLTPIGHWLPRRSIVTHAVPAATSCETSSTCWAATIRSPKPPADGRPP